jgi:hypothetical protein
MVNVLFSWTIYLIAAVKYLTTADVEETFLVEAVKYYDRFVFFFRLVMRQFL